MPLDDGKGERDLQKTKVMRARCVCEEEEGVMAGIWWMLDGSWWVAGAAHSVHHPWRLIMRAISGVSCGNEFCGSRCGCTASMSPASWHPGSPA